MKTKDSVKTTKDWFGPLATALTFTYLSAFAQTPQDVAAELAATVATTKPVVTLNWVNIPGRQDPVYLTRTEITATGRGSVASFSVATNYTTFADNTAVAGKRYEYQFAQRVVVPSGTTITRKVNLTAGAELPLLENRGRVLLLVDATMADALTEELADLADDLTLDGWVVVRSDVARMAVSPDDTSATAATARKAELAAARQPVVDFYNADKTNSKALILIGRVPVPYSGNIMPDGHADHLGAWPADMYYADVNGTWTDTSVNNTAAGRLKNVPGDGKFDQSSAPTAAELEVGRIDFAGLPGQAKSEVELLRQYLVRNHAYRHGLAPYDQVRREVVIDDNFGFFSGEAFAAVGWNFGTTVLGRANARAAKWFVDRAAGAPSLFAYGCGGGNYVSASGVGSSADFGTRPSRAVFNGLFGSYFGDWNVSDGFVRSSLAGPADSTGLAAFWVNRPNWDFSGTALGGSLGSTLRFSSDRSVHRAVLGDPTLRVQHRPAVAHLRATRTAGGLLVEWDALGQGELGYHVYRTDLAAGTTVRVTGGAVSTNAPAGSPITATSFLNSGFAAGTRFSFTVKPVFKETTPSGNYYAAGLGSFVEATQPGPAVAVEFAVSRRDHATGAYDLPLVANKTEPRCADGNLKLVVRFNQPVTAANVSVAGQARVVSQVLTGNELTVLLANVVNRQTLTLGLDDVVTPNAATPGEFSFPVRLLLGDMNQNGVVDNYDSAAFNSFVKAANCTVAGVGRMADLNGDGRINSADLVFVIRNRGLRLD